jgi:predicted dehydrogenase
MHLSPEAQRQGEENFQAAIASELLAPQKDASGQTVSRRDFLIGSVTAGLVSGGGLGSYYFGYGASVGKPVRIGIIGTGDEGGVLIGALNPEYVDTVAIADIRPYNVFRAFHGDHSTPNAYTARPGLMNKYGWKTESQARKHVKVYDQNYHDLLKDPNVEGVIIALPLHLHAPVAIEAMKAGKHVLTEKLMAKTIKQCKEMARASRETQKYLATGHQRHYSILYDNATQLIQSGVLGKLHHIRAQWHRGNLPGRDSWQPPLPEECETKLATLRKQLADPKVDPSRAAAIRESIDLLEKQVLDKVLNLLDPLDSSRTLAERYGYEAKANYYSRNGKKFTRSAAEELIRWRLFERTGGGLMAELGSHQLDASSIFISAMYEDRRKVQPLRVTAMGGRHVFPHDRDCEDHVYCTFEFPTPGYDHDDPATHGHKIVVTYSSINGNDHGGYGEVVMGTNGTLILEEEQKVMLFGNAAEATQVKVTKKKDDIVLDTTQSPKKDADTGKKALSTGPISRGYTEEIEHWAWCIRNASPEVQPKCKPEVALSDAVIALTTNIAIRQNKIIEFKKDWFDVESDATPEGDFPASGGA